MTQVYATSSAQYSTTGIPTAALQSMVDALLRNRLDYCNTVLATG